MPPPKSSSSGHRKRLEEARCLDQATMRTDVFVEQTQTLDGGDIPKINQQSRRYTKASVLHENRAVTAILLLGVDLLWTVGYRTCRSLSCVNSAFRMWDAWKVNIGLNQIYSRKFSSCGSQLSVSRVFFTLSNGSSHSPSRSKQYIRRY